MNEQVRSGTIRLHAERAGRRRPLLLISGLGYSSWCWTEMRERLEPRHEVITFDNRGTGRSDKPDGPYSMELLADDAAAVLDHFGVAAADVLGHSMGGYIAQTLALRHPQRVRSLVLISTSPGGPKTLPLPAETQAAWQAAAGLSVADNVRATMPRTFTRGWAEAHPQDFESILQRRLEHPTPRNCWLAQFQACADHIRRGVQVEGIGVPALVIHGDDDRIVPVENGRQLAGRLPHAQYMEIPGNGHLPYLEDPDRIAAMVEAHLQRVAADGAR